MKSESFLMKCSLRWITAMLTLLVGIGYVKNVDADGEINVTPTKLVFRGPRTEAVQRTFSVQGKPFPKLSITRHDLVSPDTGAVILSSNVNVTTTSRKDASDTEGGAESFSVTISGATRPARYLGRLEIRDEAKPTSTPLIVEMEVVFEAVPSLEPEVNSKSLTLYLRQPLFDIPYSGQPSAATAANPDNKAMPELTVYLVQNAEGDAEVENAELFGLRGTKGALPEGTLKVISTFPFIVTKSDAGIVNMVAAGKDLDAGEYNSTLKISVKNQASSVQVPIKVLVKHGPLVALIVLALGLAAAALFGWWNSQGKATRDLVSDIQRLARDIREGKKLQADERDEAVEMIRSAMKDAEDDRPQAEVKKKFDEAQTYVNENRAEADKFLKESLGKSLTDAEALKPGRTIREGIIGNLDAIKERVTKGQYRRLVDAENQLKPLNGQIAAFKKIIDRFSEVPPDKTEATKTAMDNAKTTVEMRAALAAAGVDVPAEAGGASFALPRSGPPAEAKSDLLELSLKRKLQLSIGALAVTAIAYLFVLAVGWVTLYAKADTFGADPMDYVSVFLWGATVEAVRGQTVSFTSLKTVVENKPAGQEQPG
jgi:hypothetical protein